MKVIALYQIKGGVGKTTTAVNLAYTAAAEGATVLLWDLDPQGAASFCFRVRGDGRVARKKALKDPDRLAQAIKGSDFERLDILPADLSYRRLDRVLAGMKKNKKRLRQAVEGVADAYDYVFLDAPPTLTLLAEAVFRAADLVLMPVVPTVLCETSYRTIVDFFHDQALDASQLAGFFSMVQRRRKTHGETMDRMIAHDTDGRLLQTAIPFRAAIERTSTLRQPVALHAPRSPSCRAYQDLWGEVATRLAGEARRYGAPGSGGRADMDMPYAGG